MLSEDDVAEIEGYVEAFRRELGCDEWSTAVDLCVAATGHPPILVDRGPEARLVEGVVQLRRGVPDERARQKVTHELGHIVLARAEHPPGPLLEAKCDLFGAAACMPRSEVRSVLREVGHRVHVVARHFGVTQSVSLLRIGEVARRPVMLRYPGGTIVRGAPIAWPSLSTIRRELERGSSTVHPVRISDEPNRIGFMMTRDAWLAMSA